MNIDTIDSIQRRIQHASAVTTLLLSDNQHTISPIVVEHSIQLIQDLLIQINAKIEKGTKE